VFDPFCADGHAYADSIDSANRSVDRGGITMRGWHKGSLRLLAIAICATVPPLSVRAAEWSPALQRVIADAKQEGKLTLMTSGNVAGGSDGAKAIQAGIATMFGVTLATEWSPAPSFAPMVAKVQQEFQAGVPASTDVYFGAAPQLGPYIDGNLFRKIAWAQLWPERIKDGMVEQDRSLRYETFLPGILYNVKAAPWVKGIKVVTDVLKPEYKGKFATTPYLSGFDALVAEHAWGMAKTSAFVARLAGQVSGLMACSGTDRIASGEVPALVVDCSGSAQNVPRYHGILDTEIPSDIAMRRYVYAQVPTNAAHPNAGILAALYLVSPAGQHDVAFGMDGIDDDDYPETWTHQRVASLEDKGVKFLIVDIGWWKTNPHVDQDFNELVKVLQKN
jgi:ABC-type Fe3+ transport system substrate-binding protein